MTAVQWLIQQINGYSYPLPYNENIRIDIPKEVIEQAKAMEEQQIKDAIMYALDEDGHTGDWKIKFANDYINNLKQNKQ
jgi:hypothetical protein